MKIRTAENIIYALTFQGKKPFSCKPHKMTLSESFPIDNHKKKNCTAARFVIKSGNIEMTVF